MSYGRQDHGIMYNHADEPNVTVSISNFIWRLKLTPSYYYQCALFATSKYDKEAKLLNVE